jgi:chemotaxis signal transduction protein
VNDILPLSSEQLIPKSSIIWNNKSSILAGVAKIDNLLFLVLDIDYLLQEEEQKIFKEICLSLAQ